MKRYTYRQNNSGGYLVGPQEVSVLAESATEADLRVQEEHNVYFDGVASGQDCPCCGDRWGRASEYAGLEVKARASEEQVVSVEQLSYITLRDYFAAQAVMGIVAKDEGARYEHFAHRSYKIADAMLYERSKSDD